MSTAGLAFARQVRSACCCAEGGAPGAEVKMRSASTNAGKVMIRRCILARLSSELSCELAQIRHECYHLHARITQAPAARQVVELLFPICALVGHLAEAAL